MFLLSVETEAEAESVGWLNGGVYSLNGYIVLYYCIVSYRIVSYRIVLLTLEPDQI
mgnify:CR=1 FL=1